MENKKETIGIHQIWADRDDFDNPELIDAWDEYSINNNYEGWKTALTKARTYYGAKATIRVAVSYIDLQLIRDAFNPVKLDATDTTIE